MRYDILLLNLLQVTRDCHSKGHTFLAHAHQLLDLLEVLLRTVVLMLLKHLYVGTAIALSDMLNEICTITDLLSFKSIHEGTVPFVEAI